MNTGTSRIISVPLSVALMTATVSGRAAPADDSHPRDLIADYFESLDAVYRAGSTPGDIETLFTLFSDDVTYTHVRYGAKFNAVEWREAFGRNLSDGRYDKAADACSAITDFIPGHGYAALAYTEGTMAGDDCVAGEGERLLAVFSYRDGRITAVEELW